MQLNCVIYRDIFRTLPNICDRVFFYKKLLTIFANNFIINGKKFHHGYLERCSEKLLFLKFQKIPETTYVAESSFSKVIC